MLPITSSPSAPTSPNTMRNDLPAPTGNEFSLFDLLLPNVNHSSYQDSQAQPQGLSAPQVPQLPQNQAQVYYEPRNLPPFQPPITRMPLPPVSELATKKEYEQYYMNVCEQLRSRGANEDEKVFIESYPKLRQAYDAELEELYASVEESCVRILGNTKFPDLSNYAFSKAEGQPDAGAMNAFHSGMKQLEKSPKLDQMGSEPIPAKALEPIKKWQEFNPNTSPNTESKLALVMDTGIDFDRLSRHFDKELVTNQNGYTYYGDSNGHSV